MMNRLSACFFAIVLFAACNKKDKVVSKQQAPSQSLRVMVTKKEVRAGETGIVLPIGTTLTFAEDGYSIEVELPADFSFMERGDIALNSTQPVRMATYRCLCSNAGNACQVMYDESAGFGCLHSSCTGSCNGDFIYKGYSLNRVVALPDGPKYEFFNDADVQEKIAAQFSLCVNPAVNAKTGDMVYVKQQVYGIAYYFLANAASLRDDVILEVVPYGKASCDCEGGGKSCTLKSTAFALEKNGSLTNKIFYCDGPCGDDCQMTVN